ncbi:hypothetical protein F2Q70_00002628 [Brassica cretica]|uniref:Uncharacterized protein n=1 Tax=Brassica cretica TaxID=69181 RepID=A0A8S9J1G4_BRACR|nr:hypothetical protein F2Q70_00002628 [Brassica cretica]
MEYVASCETVRIMTHEEFAARHPHPPQTYRVTTEDIDRQKQPSTGRHQMLGNDRQVSSSVDRHPPLTYRVRLPRNDVARLNALRNPSKPLETSTYNNSQQSEDALEPMVVEQATKGRTLRKRKEKVSKHLKRGATEKEIDNFTKRDLGMFVVPCLIGGIDCPSAFCDTTSSVTILSKVMAYHLGLEIEPSKDLFPFVDCSQRNSGGIIINLEE